MKATKITNEKKHKIMELYINNVISKEQLIKLLKEADRPKSSVEKLIQTSLLTMRKLLHKSKNSF